MYLTSASTFTLWLFLVILLLIAIILILFSEVKKQAILYKVANLDNLTNLNNMYYLKENFKDYVKNKKNVRISMIDFRKLKYINDTYGHKEGDKCLVAFSDSLKEVFTNSILVRISGDEFLVVSNFTENNLINPYYYILSI